MYTCVESHRTVEGGEAGAWQVICMNTSDYLSYQQQRAAGGIIMLYDGKWWLMNVNHG